MNNTYINKTYNKIKTYYGYYFACYPFINENVDIFFSPTILII